MPSTLTYPTGGDYREALFNTNRCFRDSALVGGEPVVDSLGLPKAISGASASVFTIRGKDGRQWAVKCFTRFVDDQAIRYHQISEALAAVNEPWRVGFDYLAEGVMCQGSWYPALKMEWVEATSLIPFVEANLLQPSALGNLAAKFAQMMEELSSHGIAHGDLQHGNLLVTRAGDLKLIDYDGMFVPSLWHVGASERGHVNYQSPARSMGTWGPDLDHFSAWIIYASLVALTIDPTLWSLLHNEGDEALLFHKDDFTQPANSRTLLALTHNPDASLQELGRLMSRLWAADLRTVPALNPASAPAPSSTLLGLV